MVGVSAPVARVVGVVTSKAARLIEEGDKEGVGLWRRTFRLDADVKGQHQA